MSARDQLRELIADRLGEHPLAHNRADATGEQATYLADLPVEDLAEWLLPALELQHRTCSPYDPRDRSVVCRWCGVEPGLECRGPIVAIGNSHTCRMVDGFEARKRQAELAKCSGASDCPSGLHVHGCFADLDGSACDDPDDHRAEGKTA